MAFLCREDELRTLNRRYKGGDMECVVIYGRRRVGKTALINEFVRDKPCIYFPALKASAHDNLAALSRAIYDHLSPGGGEAPVFGSFDAAFAEVTRIADNFFRFWYRFVPPNMASIGAGTFARSYDAAVGSYLAPYMGLVFEDMCRQHLLRYAEDLPFPIGEVGEWWGTHPATRKQAQVDVVALAPKQGDARGGRRFIIGSCKYTTEPVGTAELDLMRNYASAFTTGRDELHYYAFSKSGFTKGMLELRDRGEVTLVTLEDMYRELHIEGSRPIARRTTSAF